MNMRKRGTKVWGGKSTVNDWMMRYIGLPIVWGWLVAALGIVAMGVYDPTAVMPMLEGYIALLAIVGTLATLIVTSMLELWKSEQNQEITSMPEMWTARQRESETEALHLREMNDRQAAHIRELEAEAQKVSLGLISGETSEE